MGLTEQWVLFRGYLPSDVSALPVAVERRDPPAAGWSALSIGQLVPLQDLHGFAQRISDKAEGPAASWYVEDSDWAYVSGTDRQHAFRLIINEAAVAGYQEGVDALDLCREAYGESWRKSSAQAVSDWSSVAPKRINPEVALRLLTEEWTFAEDGVERLLTSCGLKRPPDRPAAQFEEAEYFQDRGAMFIGGKRLSMEGQRFLLGYGKGFIGIWDRECPGQPIRRFPRSAELEAGDEWARLVTGSVPP